MKVFTQLVPFCFQFWFNKNMSSDFFYERLDLSCFILKSIVSWKSGYLHKVVTIFVSALFGIEYSNPPFSSTLVIYEEACCSSAKISLRLFQTFWVSRVHIPAFSHVFVYRVQTIPGADIQNSNIVHIIARVFSEVCSLIKRFFAFF